MTKLFIALSTIYLLSMAYIIIRYFIYRRKIKYLNKILDRAFLIFDKAAYEPIGVIDLVVEDEKGLFIKARMQKNVLLEKNKNKACIDD